MIADNLNKLENDIKESYNSLNGFDIPENKNTDNLPNTIENAITTLKTYIPSATSENGTCENAVPLNASVEVDGNSKQDTYEGYNLIDFSKFSYTSYGTTVKFENENVIVIGDGTTTYQHCKIDLLSFFERYKGKTITVQCEDMLKTDTNARGIVQIYYKESEINHYVALYSNSKIRYSFTIPSDISNITQAKLQLYANDDNVPRSNTTTYIKPMIFVGSELETKSYEPYVGGTSSPNPDYPQDIEVVDGVNLLPTENGKSETINGVTFTKNNDGTITANGTANAGINYYPNGYVYTSLEKGTYILSDNVISGESITTYFTYLDPVDSSTVGNKTFSISEKTNVRARIVIREGQTLNNIVFKPMLVKGTEPKPYLPYGHIGLRQSGKNLLNITDTRKVSVNGITYKPELDEKGEYYILLNGTSTSSYWHITSTKIELEAGTYTFSTNLILNNIVFSLYDYNLNKDMRVDLIEKKSKTFTINTKTIFSLIYWIRSSNASINNEKCYLQIENGATATPYEPYHEPKTYAIDLAGNSIAKVGDVKDLLSISEKVEVELEKKINKVVLDGSENLNRYGLYNDFYLYYFDDTSLNGYAADSWDKEFYYGNGLSTHFVWNLRGDYKESDYVRFQAANGNRLYLGFKKDFLNSTSELKTWLSEHKPEVTYLLATPQKLTLPTTEPIKMWEGTNNFELITNLDTTYRIKYYIDKNAIMNKILELGGGI